MTQALQDLLYTRLAAASCASSLAVWNGDPAIFHDQAKSDQDVGWSGLQYPRLVYGVSRQQDPQRGTQGTVTVDLEVRADQTLLPWDLAACVKAALDGSAFHPDGEPVQALRWSQTLEFQPAQENDQVKGLTLLFDLSAFPSQAIPQVQAVYSWIAQQYPGQYQTDPPSWGPDESTPAVYVSLDALSVMPTMIGARATGTFMIRVLQADAGVRQANAAQLASGFGTILRLVCPDGRVMRFGESDLRFEANLGADPQRQGQIRRDARWGVLPLDSRGQSTGPLIHSIVGELAATGADESFVTPGQPSELQEEIRFEVPPVPTAKRQVRHIADAAHFAFPGMPVEAIEEVLTV